MLLTTLNHRVGQRIIACGHIPGNERVEEEIVI